MEKDIEQLVEMGATAAQARAALGQYKDVMQAAERIFEGEFDDVQNTTEESNRVGSKRPPVVSTRDGAEMNVEDEAFDAEEDDGSDAFIDYDSDFGDGEVASNANVNDPYAGIFFSKDRREEVIEVEEESELHTVPGTNEQVEIMTQGKWMAGCPEGGEQSFLFGLYSQLSGLGGDCTCPQGCGESILRKKTDFFAIYPQFSSYIHQLRKTVLQTCSRCKTEFCLACGEKVSKATATQEEADPLWHCSNLQGVILGIGLYMVERIFEEQRDSSEPREVKGRESKRRKTGLGTSGDDIFHGHGIAKKQKGGIGYAGDQKEDNSGQAEAQAQQAAKDHTMAELLAEVRVFLPSLQRSEGVRTSDYLPHPTSLTHLRRRFNVICSALLRNDSLADMSDRNKLYFELLEWLETISNHEALASMMAMPIMAVASVKNVVKKSSTSSNPRTHIRERVVLYEGSSSPRELLESVAIQARAALKGLESSRPPEEEVVELTEEQKRKSVAGSKGKSKEDLNGLALDDSSKLSNFCNRLLVTIAQIDRSLRDLKGDDFMTRLHSSLPNLFASSSNLYFDAGDSEESAKKAYVEWATGSRFEYCDLSIPANDEDQTPSYKHHYNSEARMLANSNIPKRSLAIAKELAILTTNLPVAWDSTIFLRVDETRVDVIKCLITGPEGTPYHNGCFLFDVFLGASYNQSPPSVKYMTTNGGKYRFNPNLYADGKVCLSLLGTWSGPGWVPYKSTLLQVLISIQSMILCDEPYLNEPGWADSAGSPQSRAYSANVRRMVVKTAMLDTLSNPPEPFADVILTHFRLKARSIHKQLDRWLEEDDGRATAADGAEYSSSSRGNTGTASSNGFKADIDKLKKLLEDL